MAQLSQILDFETHLEHAAREALFADYGLRALLTRTPGTLPEQYVAARAVLGAPENQHHFLNATTSVESLYRIELTYFVRTVRESDEALAPAPLHAALRAQIRAFITGAVAAINARLTLHELAPEITPGANTLQYSNDTYDITEMPFTAWISVKEDAWPA